MTDMNRRQFVAAAGVGTGFALGAGATAGRDGPGVTELEAEFTAEVDSGFLVLDGDDPDDSDATIAVELEQLEESLEIVGEVYEDRTWASDDVAFRDIDPGELIGPGDLPDPVDDINFDDETEIEVIVDTIEGTYDPEEGLVTGDVDMLIDAYVLGEAETDFGDFEFEFDFELDINDGEDIELTSEESNGTGTAAGLEGETENLGGEDAAATVVSNEFVVPEAEGDTEESFAGGLVEIDINEELELPAEPEGRNWIELDIEPDWVGDPPFGPPALPGQDDPPQDLDGDGNHEDITGDGEVTVFDTQVLFNNLEAEAVQENAAAFNFNPATPDDEVTILDVASHWQTYIYE